MSDGHYDPGHPVLKEMRRRARYIQGRREEWDVAPRKFDHWVEAAIAEADGIDVDILLRSCRGKKK